MLLRSCTVLLTILLYGPSPHHAKVLPYNDDNAADRMEIFAQAIDLGLNEDNKDLTSPPYYYQTFDATTLDRLCSDERCFDVADLFMKSVKRTQNPCGDFYGYACGRKQSRMRSLTREIEEILEEKPSESSSGSDDLRSLQLERRFYRSCMEQHERNHKTRREFSQLLEQSNGISLFRKENNSRKRAFGETDWQRIDNFYASLGFEHTFFNVHVTRDPQDGGRSDVNLIALMPPSPLYFYSVHSLLKYKNFTGIVAHLVGDDLNDYVTDYEDVIDFNNALHEILPPLGMFEENQTTLASNKMTIGKWQRIYDGAIEDQDLGSGNDRNHIDWLKLLNSFLGVAYVRVDQFEQVVVKKTDYFTKLAQLLDRTPSVTVEKYIHFKFLTQISKYLSPSLARYFQNIRDRSTFCIKQSDNQLVGATYEYIRRHVPHEQKTYAEEIIENVRKALTDLLSNASWMDRETRRYAMSKLEKLDILVGYPDWQTNRTLVNNYYGNLRLHGNFFDNVIKYRRRAMVHELRALKHPYSYDPLTMSKKLVPFIYHFEVNSHLNRILFPTEYLNEKKYKLFSTKLPSAINYGSFGSMLGSILYDYVSLTDNLKYNEFYSRTIEGLSKETIEAYKVKEKCLSNQLTSYKKSATKLLDSPLASVIDRDTIQVDKIYEKMVGLRAAFEAYRKVHKSDDKMLPGFNDMTNYQLFFLSYAERICEIGDVYDRYDAYETASKVNGVVSNLEAFSQVFHCPRHSAMNREKKCELFS